MGYVRTAGMSTAARRARRRAALVITALLAVLALALGLSLAYMQGWIGTGDGEGTDQAADTSAVTAPAPALTPDRVVVNVYNGTDVAGLAGRTSEALTTRGFRVDAVDNGDPVEGAGVIRHGAEGLEGAELLLQTVGQPLTLVQDERDGLTVDLLLGPDWEELPTADDAAQTGGR